MTDELREKLGANLAFVLERIDSACQSCGRSPQEVTLVAVTKYAELPWIRELVNLGITNLGESRPQQLVRRARELPQQIHWHFIGHLQRNKAADVIPVAELIHSVDSVRLLQHLATLGQQQERTVRMLLEVNVSGESSKNGFSIPDLLDAWPTLCQIKSIEVLGLMTMAPLDDNSEAARPVFRQLRELRDRLRDECNGRWTLHELSMGMSGDFEAGIEEGATLVRIGSRLFENLPSTLEPPAA